MRTVRNSSRPRGGVCSWGLSAPGGGLLLGGVSAPRGVCSGGGRGCGIPTCTEAELPPPLWTDTYKNITFATSLRTVIIELKLIITRVDKELYNTQSKHAKVILCNECSWDETRFTYYIHSYAFWGSGCEIITELFSCQYQCPLIYGKRK